MCGGGIGRNARSKLLDTVLCLFYAAVMDLAAAIDRHRASLLRIVATLFALIGLSDTGAIARLPRPLHRAVLLVLRPAEAAVRRLVMVAARGLVVKPSPLRPAPPGLVIAGQGRASVSFQLFDPHRPSGHGQGRADRRYGPQPRIRLIEAFDPRIPLFRQVPPPPEDRARADDTVNALPLCRRLAAIRLALEDLPRQARRLARWQARPIAVWRPRRATPLRPGRPPGFRRRPIHEVDDILAECHWLASDGPAGATA
jgi:hypothetical protein